MFNLKTLSAAVLLSAPLLANAGMGNLRVNSHLNEPFSGTIALTDEEATIAANQPSAVTISSRAGLRVHVAGTSSNPVLVVSSSSPMNEPITSFVIRVGDNIRQYSALLDPAAAPAKTTKQTAKQTKSTDGAKELSPVAAKNNKGEQVALGSAQPGKKYVVQGGDTIIAIARSITPSGGSLQRTMRAITAKNPHALANGNPNNLKKGAVLVLPTIAEINNPARIATKKVEKPKEEKVQKPAVDANAEAQRKAEQEAKRKAEQEAKAKAEQEAQRKAEQEVQRKAEQEAKAKAEQEAQLKAEEEARLKAEQDAQLKADEEARLKAEQDALLKAEEEARQRALEEEARLAAQQKAEQEAQQQAQKPEEEIEVVHHEVLEIQEEKSGLDWMKLLPFLGAGLLALLLLGWLLGRKKKQEPEPTRDTFAVERSYTPPKVPPVTPISEPEESYLAEEKAMDSMELKVPVLSDEVKEVELPDLDLAAEKTEDAFIKAENFVSESLEEQDDFEFGIEEDEDKEEIAQKDVETTELDFDLNASATQEETPQASIPALDLDFPDETPSATPVIPEISVAKPEVAVDTVKEETFDFTAPTEPVASADTNLSAIDEAFAANFEEDFEEEDAPRRVKSAEDALDESEKQKLSFDPTLNFSFSDELTGTPATASTTPEPVAPMTDFDVDTSATQTAVEADSFTAFEPEPFAPVTDNVVASVEAVAPPTAEEPVADATTYVEPEPVNAFNFIEELKESELQPLQPSVEPQEPVIPETPANVPVLDTVVSDDDAPYTAKLELAKMYLTMDDKEGALETLYDLMSEIKDENSPVYKAAEELIQSLPQE